ncbi:MAG: hypothetical protein QXP02_05845 [Desulfurococcaceae archaeon]
MKLLSKPPRIKVMEALGALSDGRVKPVSSTKAIVKSSGGEREYKVVLIDEGGNMFRVYSNDNGTIYRGYIGYPIISLMFLKGVLPIDNQVAKAFSGIPWRELNERYKKYSIVESVVLAKIERSGIQRNIVDDYINVVFKKLGLLKVYFDESLENA